MRFCVTALAAGVGIAALGCEEGAQLTAVVPELAVSSSELDFGEVPLGSTRRLGLEVRNEGNAPLTVADVMITAPFSVAGAAALPSVLPPGGRLTLDLAFTPFDGEPASSSLRVGSDDPNTPTLAVPLRGLGVEGQLTVLPERLDFADTPVGGSRDGEVVLENLGLAPISGRVVLEAVTRPGFFTSGGATVERDFSVPARSTLPLDIAYRPLEPGDHGGRVRFETCEGRCGLEVELAATAVAPSIRLEPPVIVFGDVGLGDRRVEQLTVRNDGSDAVSVLGLAVRGGAALSLEAGTSPPVRLEPGDRLAVDVVFSPVEALEIDGAVEVRLDDPAFPLAEAGVGGRGVGPRFAVTPERVVFGALTEARPTSRAVLGLNAGSSVVRVEAVTIQGDPELRLGPLPGFPVGLGAGETLPVELVFDPRGLGAYTATISFSSSDPLAPEVQVPVVAGLSERVCELEVDPSGTINFGAVVPGFQRDRRARVINRGDQPCVLRSGSFRAPLDGALSLVSPDPFPTTLAPTDELVLDFRFAPTEERESKSIFSLRTDEPLFPVRNLSFVGTGAGYLDLYTRPRVLDFGEVGIACPPERAQVELVNAGSGPVEVVGLSLTSSTSELALSAPRPTFRVDSGQARPFTVSYDPSSPGPDTGIVVIDVDELPFPLVVPVLGLGATDPRVADRFEQPPRRDVDVLFVIDDSCSMNDEQQAIARNFQSFIQQADVRQVDFRIGVATTTVLNTAGRLVGDPITRSTSGVEATFAAQTAVGIRGSGIEQGLEATLGAIVRAERSLPPNDRLFRRDASKVFVIVSDEDDQSRLSPLSYAAELSRRFPIITAAVVTGGPAGCVSTEGSATAAPRYQAFIGELNGIFASICADWGQTLSSIGRAAFGLQTRFELGRRPDTARPIVVRVDGRVLPGSAYTVDVAGPAVIIDPPPPEGAEINVEYTPEC